MKRLFRWLGLATQDDLERLEKRFSDYKETISGYDNRGQFLAKRLEEVEKDIDWIEDCCSYVREPRPR